MGCGLTGSICLLVEGRLWLRKVFQRGYSRALFLRVRERSARKSLGKLRRQEPKVGGGRWGGLKPWVETEANPARHLQDLGLYAQGNRKTWEGLSSRVYELRDQAVVSSVEHELELGGLAGVSGGRL